MVAAARHERRRRLSGRQQLQQTLKASMKMSKKAMAPHGMSVKMKADHDAQAIGAPGAITRYSTPVFEARKISREAKAAGHGIVGVTAGWLHQWPRRRHQPQCWCDSYGEKWGIEIDL